MKVAVVSALGPDWVCDGVMDGMCRILGRKNIYATALSSWGGGPHPLVNEKASYNFEGKSQNIYSYIVQEENSIKLEDCDFLAVSVRAPIDFIKKYKHDVGGKVAVIDPNDETNILEEYVDVSDVYFKRELNDPPDPTRSKKVMLLPIGMIPTIKPTKREKTNDVLFLSEPSTHYIRPLIDKMLRSITGITIINGKKIGFNEYVKSMEESWMGISAYGVGQDCYRYWEVPYYGSMLLAQKLTRTIEDNFVNGESCIYFNNASDCRRKIRELIRDKDRIRRITEAGQKLVMSKHLSSNRAQKVLDVLLECNN